MIYPSQQICIAIDRSPQDVYNFASRPENLPLWAEGLSRSNIKNEGDVWVADSPMGVVKIRFVDENEFGVMDHYVTLPTGYVVYNPFRVVQNASGSEVIFTLFKLTRMTDEQFNQDAQMVKADLERLKTLLEK